MASYTSEVNKKNRVAEYESRLKPLRMWRQLAIANENETVSQMFTQSHPFMFWQPDSLHGIQNF